MMSAASDGRMELDRWQSLAYFGPELALGAAAAVVGGLGRVPRLAKTGLGELALLGASVAVYLAARLSGWGEVWIFRRLAIVDGFTVFFEIVVGLVAVAVLWLSLDSGEIPERDEGEYAAWILVGTLAAFLMASAATLVIAYVAFEVGCLAASRVIRVSSGAVATPAPSVVIADAIASIALIGALAWLAGFSGSADYAEINRSIFELGAANPPALVFVGAVAVAGSIYKTASAAFRERASAGSPSGAGTSAVAFVAVAFAGGVFALWLRLLFPVLSRPAAGAWIPADALRWPPLLSALAVAMMIAGGAGAVFQRDVRRLVAWASIANLGAVVGGTTALEDDGLRIVLFSFAAYALATVGAFAVAASVGRSTGGHDLDAYRGIVHRGSVPAAAAMTLFLLSLAGLPPGVGFLAKLRLGTIADRLLLGSSLLASALVLVAYGRVIQRMFSRGSADAPSVRLNVYDGSLIGCLAVVTVGLAAYDVPLADLARRSTHFVQW